jgi:hypothetical protein
MDDGAGVEEVSTITGLTPEAVMALRGDAFALLDHLLADWQVAAQADAWVVARLDSDGVRRGIR